MLSDAVGLSHHTSSVLSGPKLSVSQPGFGGHSKNNEDTSHKVALMKALHTK